MGPKRKKEFPTEQEAAERDAAVDRAADEAASRSEFKYDFVPPGWGVLTARETPSLSWGVDAAAGDGSPALVERDLNRLKHVLYSFGEQRREILQLRDSTRHVLASLRPA